MISLLIWLLIALIVFGIIVWIVRMLPLPQPWSNIALAIVALIFLLVLLSYLGVLGTPPVLLRR